MENCYNKGNVISTSYAGGIAGTYAGTVNKCTNYTNITSEGYVGGIIGEAVGSIKIINCANIGNVESYYRPVGGILGEAYANSEILNCYNIGKINASKPTAVSYANACGIASGTANLKQIYNCYTAGKLYSYYNGRKYAIGASGDLIENCYYLNNQPEENVNIEEGVNVIDEQFIKSQEFVDELNKNIEGNEELCKWKLGEDGYPTFE